MFEIERVGILLMRFNPFDELMFDVVKRLGILWGPVPRTTVGPRLASCNKSAIRSTFKSRNISVEGR